MFNYKDYHSIVLMAAADADYRFVYVDIGSYGKDCESTIFKHSSLWTSIMENAENIPSEESLRGTETPKIPYFFIGDEAFPLHEHLLRLTSYHKKKNFQLPLM
jgi:hypothetical protein